MGQPTTNHSVYKGYLKGWLADGAFWVDMDKYVLHWGQETYVSPAHTCVASANVAAKSERINDYVEHVARLAGVGPASAASARTFFDKAYFPLMTAFWQSSLYGGTTIPLAAMKHLVSLETYARGMGLGAQLPRRQDRLRLDNTPAGASATDTADLAARVAAAIQGAYAIGGGAAQACSPSGATPGARAARAGPRSTTPGRPTPPGD